MSTVIMILGWILAAASAIYYGISLYRKGKVNNRTPYFPKTKEDTLKELNWHQRWLKAAYESGEIPQSDYIKKTALIAGLRLEAEQQQ